MRRTPPSPRDRWTVALGRLAVLLATAYVAARGLGLAPSFFHR